MKVIATYTVLIAVLLLPLFIMAETIVVKTKAPQNRNAVFQYRVPKEYYFKLYSVTGYARYTFTYQTRIWE